MAYEVEFISVGKEVKKDASAICVRWKVHDKNGNEAYKIAVYDGGFEEHGEKMVQHMNEYYFDDLDSKKKASSKVVDLVIVSHPDQDHATGVKSILENFKVKKLVMNRPWLYVDELYKKVDDGRITKKSLENKLREKYGAVAELEKIANEKKIPIIEGFQGAVLEDALMICSPTKQFYLDLLVKSDKTPLEDSPSAENSAIYRGLGKFKSYVLSLLESWDVELLREDAETSADNETSIVVRGLVDGAGFLLCGDAGVGALDAAMSFLDSRGEDVRETVSFYEVPHHGSRHNVSPSILDRMIGEKVGRGEARGCTVFASVAHGSDHPLRMVTNAFKRRGAKVYKTSGDTIRHSHGKMPERNWGKIEEVGFYEKVEEWK